MPNEPLPEKLVYNEAAQDAVQRLLERGKAFIDDDGYLKLAATPQPSATFMGMTADSIPVGEGVLSPISTADRLARRMGAKFVPHEPSTPEGLVERVAKTIVQLFCGPGGIFLGGNSYAQTGVRGGIDSLIVDADFDPTELATRILAAIPARTAEDERAWLVEESFGTEALHWVKLAEDSWPRLTHIWSGRRGETTEYRTPVERVKDANAALRFARKEDAEAFIKLFDRFLLHPVATEHKWFADAIEQGAHQS